MDGNGAEQQTIGRKRERDRIADHQENDKHREHQGANIGDEQRAHCPLPSAKSCGAVSSSPWVWCGVGSGMRFIKNATRFMVSEIPCKASRKNPTGIISFTGQRSSPLALGEVSGSANDAVNTGQARAIIRSAMGSKKKIPPIRSIQARERGERRL